MSYNNKEMNTYKKIPVIYKKNKDGELMKTIYPVYWNIQKEKHLENYKNVLNKLFVKSLQLKYKSDTDRNVIINHIYDTYYNEYKFNIEDITIIQEPRLDGEPNCYMVDIDNDNWSVQYYIQIISYGQQLNRIMDEYIRENISYFQTHTIWIHLQDYHPPAEEIEPSNFEDTDTKCPICLEEYCEEKVCDKLHNCGHKYCVDCIDQVIEYGSCSICRTTTDINEEQFNLTIEDIENWKDEENNEKLIELLIDADEYEGFKDYCINSDGYTHLLRYESGTDFTDHNGTENILMCRLDAYEKKTNTIFYK
jgi:hypothetical protein